MKDKYYVFETEQKGGYEFAGKYYAGRFYPKNDLINGFGSDRPDIVNITTASCTDERINYGITLFSSQNRSSVLTYLNCPLIYFNNFVDSSFSLFELFPDYIWEQLDNSLYRFTGYGKVKNSGIVRLNSDYYTFTLLGDIV